VLLLMLAYLLLSLIHERFASFAAVPVAIASAGAIEAVRAPLARLRPPAIRTLGWVTATLAVSVGFTVSGGVVAAAGAKPEATLSEQCDLPAAAAHLDKLAGGEPATVLALIDVGPELLYRSAVSVVSGPYHRNVDGILDEQRFFASTDFEVSRTIANERRAAFVLVCGSRTESGYYHADDPDLSLYEALIDGDPPPWLAPVASTDDGPYHLFAVAD
jgi:hypothetical protein